MEIKQYKSPTELLLEPFREKKKEIFDHLEGYLYLYGYMGEEIIDKLGALPPSVEALVEACKGSNVFNVLDAVYKVDRADIAKISKEDAENIFLLFTQTACRHNNGMEVCKFLCETDWNNPTEEQKEHLVRIMNPKEYSEGGSIPKLYYQNRGKVNLLKKIPPDAKVIDYAEPKDYGSFIRSLKTGDTKEFIKAYSRVVAISFSSPFS